MAATTQMRVDARLCDYHRRNITSDGSFSHKLDSRSHLTSGDEVLTALRRLYKSVVFAARRFYFLIVEIATAVVSVFLAFLSISSIPL